MAKHISVTSANGMYTIVLVQSDIRKYPLFRQQFHEMCAKVGVDPLASNKGVWAELLGIGAFYYELGSYTLASFDLLWIL